MFPTERPERQSVSPYLRKLFVTLSCLMIALLGISLYNQESGLALPDLAQATRANGTYFDLSSSSLNFNVTAATVNQISSNDSWSAVQGVEGYFGQNLTATHGVDPQTVLGTEFSGDILPNTPTQINANKSNPSAYNAGGLAEFDTGTYLAIGFQGNVQANPYLVFYLNTTGRSNVTISYDVTDIDSGNNNAVSPVALQYRVGSSGLFTNLPSGLIADATDGPNIGGRVTHKSVVLPATTWNQPQVQVRIITTNAANSSGGSTPDEWVGVNNVVVTTPSAGETTITGRVFGPYGKAESLAVVTLTDERGSVRQTRTNSFGYYRFTGVTAGFSYILFVESKRYQYEPQFVAPTDDLYAVNFVPASSNLLMRSVR